MKEIGGWGADVKYIVTSLKLRYVLQTVKCVNPAVGDKAY